MASDTYNQLVNSFINKPTYENGRPTPFYGMWATVLTILLTFIKTTLYFFLHKVFMFDGPVIVTGKVTVYEYFLQFLIPLQLPVEP